VWTSAQRRGHAKAVARAGVNHQARDDPDRVTLDGEDSGTRDAALARADAGSVAIGRETAGNAGPEGSGVIAMRANDARDATTIGPEAVEAFAIAPTKDVFQEPLVSGMNGASAGNESVTPSVRGVRSRDGVSAHWRVDRGRCRCDVQWQE
jgi:hypothetical protein